MTVGAWVSSGTTVALVSNLEEADSIVAFVTPYEGSRIRPGMLAEVTPGSIKREEFGFIQGSVTGVSERPVSNQEIDARFLNPALTQMFTSSYAPIMVSAQVKSNPGSPSGYSWASGKGPPFKIRRGSLINMRVVVGEQPPITLLFPILKRWFGGE